MSQVHTRFLVGHYNPVDVDAVFKLLAEEIMPNLQLQTFPGLQPDEVQPFYKEPADMGQAPEMTTPRTADHPIDPRFLERWSPRAFADDAIGEDELMSLLEAARWAPSSYNSQPWRFIYALRGEPAFDTLLGLLIPGNQGWAVRAAALVFIASKRTMRPRGAEADVPSHSHSFDAGSAWGYLALQAQISGWAAHGMTGVDFPRAAEVLGVPDDFRLEAAVAIGRQGDKAVLPPRYQAMEEPSGREPLSALAFKGRFGG